MFGFYRIVLLVKLVAVLVYAGGLAGTFIASEHEARRKAVHGVASPALLAVWLLGYVLTTQVDVALTELWILGGMVSSLASMLVLVHCAAKDVRSRGLFVATALPLVLTLAFMVFRPTWSVLHAR